MFESFKFVRFVLWLRCRYGNNGNDMNKVLDQWSKEAKGEENKEIAFDDNVEG